MEIQERRERNRNRRFERYHSDPEFRAKQIQYSCAYQKRMWNTSLEFRLLKAYQRKNPRVPPIKGRPRLG